MIELAYAHAAWFVGDVKQPAQHADNAAHIFDEIDSPHYAKRARTLGWLLKAWPHGSGADLPSAPDGLEEFFECVKALRGTENDLRHISEWLSKQRPSTVLGLIQFAKSTQNWMAPVRMKTPATLHRDENGKLAWRAPEEVKSISELDVALRGYLAIEVSRRIPLITD